MSRVLSEAISKSKIAESFARAAKDYDEYAFLQREIADSLLDLIDSDFKPKVILDVGSGTGYCTKILKKQFPDSQIISLDVAEGMLVFAKNESDSFVCADAENLPFIDDSIDLIVSSLAIQWCSNYWGLFSELKRVLSNQGSAFLSTFGSKTLQELKEAWSKVDSYTHVNSFEESHVLADIVSQEGFSTSEVKTIILERYYKSFNQLSQELKKIGAHNMNRGQSQGLGGRKRLLKLKSAFESKSIENLGVPVTYDVIYLSLVK